MYAHHMDTDKTPQQDCEKVLYSGVINSLIGIHTCMTKHFILCAGFHKKIVLRSLSDFPLCSSLCFSIIKDCVSLACYISFFM